MNDDVTEQFSRTQLMDFLQTLLDTTELPIITAFLLGLMTAISPCPLATNITAIGYIGRDMKDRRKVFIGGLIYTAGRAISYTALGLAIYFGASTFDISRIFQGWGERMLGPLLILIGLVMLEVLPLRFPGLSSWSEKIGRKAAKGRMGVLLLGMVFAVAFCPYSGVLYFGMLIPMTVASPEGLYLPVVYAVATGLPVVIVAWILAFMVSSIGSFYDRMKSFELWSRRIVAIVFIVSGLYFIVEYYL